MKMNIYGIGVDIVEIGKIREVVRRNKRFLSRVYAPREIEYCEKKTKKMHHYAVRFAAKEAVYKSLGVKGLSLKDIRVQNLATGKPEVKVTNRKFKDFRVLISLSHSDNYAVAYAISLKRG